MVTPMGKINAIINWLLRNYFIQSFYGLIQLFQRCFTNDSIFWPLAHILG